MMANSSALMAFFRHHAHYYDIHILHLYDSCHSDVCERRDDDDDDGHSDGDDDDDGVGDLCYFHENVDNQDFVFFCSFLLHLRHWKMKSALGNLIRISVHC